MNHEQFFSGEGLNIPTWGVNVDKSNATKTFPMRMTSRKDRLHPKDIPFENPFTFVSKALALGFALILLIIGLFNYFTH